MKSALTVFITTLCLILSAITLFGNEQTQAAEQKPEPIIQISGRIYMDYWLQLDNNTPEDKTKHGLRLTRTYLSAEKKFYDYFKAVITIDGAPTSGTSGSSTYDVFVKNAYLQGDHNLGDIGKMQLRAGLIGTPVIGLVDGLSDYRWIYQNYIDRSGDILKGGATTSDTSADLGLSLKVDLIKMFSITGMYSNGEGYNKYTSGEYPEMKNTGKTFHGVLTFNPLDIMKELNISAFARHKQISLNNSDALDDLGAPAPTTNRTNIYYGTGIAWKSDLIKTGVHYLMGTDNNNGSKTDYHLIDAFLNVNLDSVTGTPILFMGRFAMGDGDKDLGNNNVTIIGAGAGYQINKNFRTLLYFQQTSYAAPGVDPDRKIWVKGEARF